LRWAEPGALVPERRNKMFDKAKQLYDLKRQADQLKKELAAEVVEVERNKVKVVISADMKVHSIDYDEEVSNGDVVKAVNDAIEEIQKVAAKKMQGQMGALKDLLGG
jgi:DNA-binding protein YbaB